MDVALGGMILVSGVEQAGSLSHLDASSMAPLRGTLRKSTIIYLNSSCSKLDWLYEEIEEL